MQGRAILLWGCAQQVLAPEINAASARVLARHGCEVLIVRDLGCCGSLPHHMGKTRASEDMAHQMVRQLTRLMERIEVDWIISNAGGCGSTLKRYDLMLEHSTWRDHAKHVARKTRDITEVLAHLGLRDSTLDAPYTVGYQSACSLQHGQKIGAVPERLLEQAGFQVVVPHEGHLCCGSAGTYNLLQPELASQLRDRKSLSSPCTQR